MTQCALGDKGFLGQIEAIASAQTIGQNRLVNPFTYYKLNADMDVLFRFEKYFLFDPGNVIPCRGLEGVTSQRLDRQMFDQEIIDEILGGMDEVRKHAFTLDQIAQKLNLQASGKDDESLDSESSRVFYVLSCNNLFAAQAHWLSNRKVWYLDAYRIGECGKWPAGTRVFRNTTLTL